MKYYFIINPAAGKGVDTKELEQNILATASELSKDVSIYMTKAIGDAEVFVRNLVQEDSDEEICFIACGGDGTFNEVLNAVIGHPKASLSVYPMGTGNDFVRNFPNAGDFCDVKALLQGEIIPCDSIEYSGIIDGEFKVRYCGNMFNIGFDCNVVDATQAFKTKPFIMGSAAYLLGVATTLIKKKGADLKIIADGKVLSDGPILLTSIANGSFCGGGVMSNPYASVQDGNIDISVIKDLGRLRFISLFPKYQKGTHLDTPKTKDIIQNLKAQEITVIPRKGIMRLCTDGEIANAEGVLFRILPGSFRLLVPKA
ncbi:MAG: hypothetical protein J6Q41_08715 [Firmicutes bacterium]|nr:hypothetical protein [Bacillota bacterium]